MKNQYEWDELFLYLFMAFIFMEGILLGFFIAHW